MSFGREKTREELHLEFLADLHKGLAKVPSESTGIPEVDQAILNKVGDWTKKQPKKIDKKEQKRLERYYVLKALNAKLKEARHG